MKKVTTLRLIILLGILLLIYAGTEFFSNSGRSKSLREELVDIDTTKVTLVQITRDGNTITLSKVADGWEVSGSDNTFTAVASRVKNAISTLQTIKPGRIATRDPGKWKEFQVDTTGTRVEIFEDKDKTLDIVLGRFGMQGQQRFHTYVRLHEDNEVYVADNFISFSVSTDVSSYRNQMLVEFQRDSVESIHLIYPEDSSFQLVRSLDGKWLVDAAPADSAETTRYLNSISRLSSSKFDNETDPETLGEPVYKAIINIMNQVPVEIRAWLKPDSTFVITSSQNIEGVFSDISLTDKLFKPKYGFLPAEE
ncbi:MAG: DUF4340 domain-containing protein [Bacteroidetes bacterium]|nr:DUF4340 domain-containing protein [Bacteroidota bacterium]